MLTISPRNLKRAFILPSLQSLHTFGLNAQALDVQYLNNIDDLSNLKEMMLSHQCMILGEGSNTVFIEDFDGSVLVNKLKGIDVKENDSEYLIEVASGESWHEFVLFCHDRQMYSFENLALIPGTVGASPIQNIGAYGVEVKDFIVFVEYFDFASGAIKKLFKDECQFGYRDSIFKSGNLPPFFITKVGFKVIKNAKLVNTYSPLDKIKSLSPSKILETVMETRQAKLPDPKDLGNAGSFFKNPVISKRHYQAILEHDAACPSYPVDTESVKLPAAYLIDKLGFKGAKLGGIACHERQPLVLVNLQNGSGKELIELAQNICQKVWERFSIKLENEVRLIGKQGLISL